MPLARPQAERLEEPPRAGDAVTAEGAEQLLGAVGGEQAADDDAQDEECEIHTSALPHRESVKRSLSRQASWMWSASAAPPNGRVRPNRRSVASGTPSTPGVSDACPRVCGSFGNPPTSTECAGVR